MKKTIVLLFFLIFNISLADTQSVTTLPLITNYCHNFLKYGNPANANLYLCREGYIVDYSYDTKQPRWVAYKLTSKSVSNKIKRRDDFQPDPAVPAKYRAELSDYRKSGYDRGHLAPYAAMDFSKESAKESFYLSNMSPQKSGLNRQGWAELEKDVRFWTGYKKEVYVYTGPIFKNSKNHKTIGKNKILVPEYFFKIIYAPITNEAIAFVMPNASVKKKNVIKYRVSIANIEQRTGLQFLTVLPTEKREKLINNVSKMWRTSYKS
ncbi:MAG: DNA/RNA non-specific endonuclease [Gammaproteobacteria bacterium]|nr:MAG: DNA/RNA non-specific endonuclease [Gammaproteobacteria bacterium]UTW43478.1 DNA/RNA non-specific endonuclease [bacterium SCSIO 12844]